MTDSAFGDWVAFDDFDDDKEQKDPYALPKPLQTFDMNTERRSLGDELSPMNRINHMDTSLLSTTSKDTVLSSLTAESTMSRSETSSVAALRGWLDDFGRQQKTHFTKTPGDTNSKSLPGPVKGFELPKNVPPPVNRGSGSLSSNSSAASSQSSTMFKPTPMTASKISKEAHLRRSYATPVRLKPKYDKNEVEATNDGYASVAKLSAWLADDPTSKKKVRQLRRGANVIAKSRKFDKGLADVIIEKDFVRKGTVAEKKHQLEIRESLSSTFDEDEAELSGLWHDPPKARSTIVVNDAATSVSVNDKKTWLSSAFKKPAPGMAKAKTDIVTGADQRHEVSSRAKQMWRQRSPVRQSQPAPADPEVLKLSTSLASLKSDLSDSSWLTGPRTVNDTVNTEPTSVTTNNAKEMLQDLFAPALPEVVRVGNMEDSAPSVAETESNLDANLKDLTPIKAVEQPAAEIPSDTHEPKRNETLLVTPVKSDDTRRWTPAKALSASKRRESLESLAKRDAGKEKTAQEEEEQFGFHAARQRILARSAQPVSKAAVEPDPDAPLDFKAAREALLKRSKKNGNAVEVANKVNRRKAVFEQMEKDNKRKSLPTARLKKTSWQTSGSTAPSQYKKTLVADIAPKKSFKQLP